MNPFVESYKAGDFSHGVNGVDFGIIMSLNDTPLGPVAVMDPPNAVGVDDTAPLSYVLSAGPNRFSIATTIRYTQPVLAHMWLAIFDVTGRLVQTLVDQELPAGRYTAMWDGTADGGRLMQSGVYLVRMRAGGFGRTLRIVLSR